MAQERVQRKSGILAFGAKALAIVLLLATFCVVVVVVDIFDAEAKAVVGDAAGIKRVELLVSKENSTAFNINRKLLRYSAAAADGNRIGTACSKDDIVIYQGSTAPLPNGIPACTVQILNTCTCVSESESGGCSICNIHVNCGWFSSARLVNPQVFRRIHYDDCLVNDGEALPPGQALSFQYANTFQYPLSVSSVVCCSA
ncbi:TPD1 protein [Citrus sinensis]|uniref:TPD1 protein homolog 1-like n=1 Tax=Citrus sinensis TaxID=2711 RepID=UPI00219B94E8|nr:TPD1 protein homolog 1-like [Citrus sinensis]XP_052290676.1 TPD1 protein homolog 1-like [Citrus sinensis]KAH9749894.1 TPD1 protein [Citrus sinensis]